VRIGTVLPIADDDGVRQVVDLHSAGVLLQPFTGLADGVGMAFVRAGHDAEDRPAQGGGADVAETQVGIAPAAVGVLIPDQPVQSAVDQRLVACAAEFPLDDLQGAHGGGGREGAAREMPGPVAAGVALGEQGGTRDAECGAQAGGINVQGHGRPSQGSVNRTPGL
jgi:hypothetical protein